MPTLSNAEENEHTTEQTGRISILMRFPTPASASMPVSAPTGIITPFSPDSCRIRCESEAVSRAILLIFRALAESADTLPFSSRSIFTSSSYERLLPSVLYTAELMASTAAERMAASLTEISTRVTFV